MKNSHLDRRSKYSLSVIRQALFDLLAEKNLEEITVVDICNAADINRGTFYKYYRDVSDLYEKIEDELVQEIHALLPQSEDETSDRQFFFKDVLTILANNKEFIFISQNKAFSERLAKKILVFFTPYIKQLTVTYQPHISDVASELLTEYIMGGCIRVVTFWLNTNMQLPIAQLEKILTHMISCSLSDAI